MTEIPQVNLVAVVGKGGAIGPADGPPMFEHEDERDWFREWFYDLVDGGFIVLGGSTFRSFVSGNPNLPDDTHVVAWSRHNSYSKESGKKGPLSPDDFLTSLQSAERPIFICGGHETYKTFMPYVTQFFIRRVALKPPYDYYMPPLFGRVQ